MNVRPSKSNLIREFEVFLDNNRENLSPNMFGELISLYEYIDDEAKYLEDDLIDLKDECKGLTEDIESLEEEIADLKE